MKFSSINAICLIAALFLAWFGQVSTFRMLPLQKSLSRQSNSAIRAMRGENTRIETLEVALGEGYKDVKVELPALFEKSEFLMLEYDVPFSINIDRPPKG